MTPDENVKQENQPIVSDNVAAEKAVSPAAEQLFETFKAAEEETNVKIAKQQDVIEKLQARIGDVVQSQNRQNQTVAACEEVLKSNAYPKLSPLISAFSESTKKSAERKNTKIAKLKKKIKKAEKKMKRMKKKQQKNHQLKGFISSLFDKNADRSAYITGMQALREDSLIRAEKKLDRVEQKLETARAKLAEGNLSHTETVKLNARIKKLEGRKETLEAKINNLTELEQSLNKLAKMEVVDAQLKEIKEATLQNAAGSTTISEAVDGMTGPEVASTIEKAVTGEAKQEKEVNSPAPEEATPTEETSAAEKQESPTEEKPDLSEQQPAAEKQETPTEEKKPAAADQSKLRKREHLTDKEFQAVIDAGLPVRAKKMAENDITVVFDVSHKAQLDQAIAGTHTQAMKR